MSSGRKPQVNIVNMEELEERFKQFLYENKGKVTNERLALLRLLYRHEGHFSIDEIIELMKREGERVSRATVYRTLDLLVQSGLIRKLLLENQETRYESELTSGHHDHIICIDCHKIIEFYDSKLELIQDQILEEHHLKPVKHIHQLYGSCILEDCPEKEKLKKKT